MSARELAKRAKRTVAAWSCAVVASVAALAACSPANDAVPNDAAVGSSDAGSDGPPFACVSAQCNAAVEYCYAPVARVCGAPVAPPSEGYCDRMEGSNVFPASCLATPTCACVTPYLPSADQSQTFETWTCTDVDAGGMIITDNRYVCPPPVKDAGAE